MFQESFLEEGWDGLRGSSAGEGTKRRPADELRQSGGFTAKAQSSEGTCEELWENEAGLLSPAPASSLTRHLCEGTRRQRRPEGLPPAASRWTLHRKDDLPQKR